MRGRLLWIVLAAACLGLFLNWAWEAPAHLPMVQPEVANALPFEMPPFGADPRGRPLLAYATQGARVVAMPAVTAGLVVALFAVAGGLLRMVASDRANTIIHAASEVVGALPRMVVILVVALVVPRTARGLLPLAVTWAALAAPGAMDESASVAERLGGERFVEALRAHGYSAARIFLYHVVALNLRPVVVRQAAEVVMQVVFLEIALSYLALAMDQPSFTHPDSLMSWADLLRMGYLSVVMDQPTQHALALGLGLVALVAVMSLSIGRAARAR